MKRTLSTFILFAAAIGFIQAQRFQSGELYYQITDAQAKTVAVTNEESFYTGRNYQNISPIVVIPETVVYNNESYSVKSICAEAFKICKAIEEITIPKSIDSIGQQALDACFALKAVHVAEDNANYSSVDGVLFNADKTSLILFPPGKTATTYTVPESVTEIKTSAFSYCGLTEIVIPDGVTSIGFGACYRCEQLEKINLPQGLKRIEYDTFYDCSRLADVSIPDGVTVIEQRAFYNCRNLWKITLPQELDSIGENAFTYCNLDEITLPQGLTTIGNGAFSSCTYLRKVTLPQGLTTIGSSTFSNCTDLSEITLPQGLTTIGSSAFSNCTSLSEIALPQGLDSIGQHAFSGCGLTEIVIPKQVRSIGDGAFGSCANLNAFQVEEGNPNYSSEEGVLFNTDKTELIQYPAGLEATEYTVPECVQTIRSYGFDNCQLQKITVPGSLKTINYCAFCYCQALTELIFWTLAPPQLSYNAFLSNNPELTIYVSGDALKSYENATYWKDLNVQTISFADGQINYLLADFGRKTVRATSNWTDGSNYGSLSAKVTIPSEVTHDGTIYRVMGIGDEAFNNCTAFQELTLADGIETIGRNAFYGCTALEEIVLPASVREIGASAFYGCTALEEIVLPDSIREIGASTFCGCTALEEITLPASVREIGREAFRNCTALKSITIADGVQAIGENAFYDCTALTEITLPGTLTTWGRFVFSNCAALQRLTLNEGITTVSYGAFSDCIALTRIDFPSTLSRVENTAFNGCMAIKEITVRATTPPTLIRNPFNNVSQETTVYVPAEALEAYAQAITWKNFNLQPIDAGTAVETTTTPDGLHIEAGRIHNPQAISLNIFDLQGRIVYQGAQTNINLPEGIYLVRGKGVSRKVMIAE